MTGNASTARNNVRLQEGLALRRAEALNGGSPAAHAKRRSRGQLGARERIDGLVDPDSFLEIDQLARHAIVTDGAAVPGPVGDGLVAGTAQIDGRTVCVFAQDFTVLGGSMGETHGRKCVKTMDVALRLGCPVIALTESGGARIQEGVVSLAYYASLGHRNVQASGVIPQIAVVAGPCAGGAVYSPAVMDFTVMVDRTSYMFVTGPDVVRAATGESVTLDELGGPAQHSEISGNAHYVAVDEADALAWVQDLLSYLPSNNLEQPPVYAAPPRPGVTAADLELDEIIPDASNQGYDVRDVIRRIVDDGELLEIHERFAQNIVCGFARIEGHSVGIVGNQPIVCAGALDIDASEKAARFVQFCDAFNIPLLTLVDIPGYLPGLDQERNGIIRRGAKLFFAYSQATVPMVSVILRKAYGGAYAVMASKHVGADINLAWPTAEVAVMNGHAAVAVLYRKELASITDPDEAEAVRLKWIDEYNDTMLTPYIAAERGYLDAVIRPSTTRQHVARALRTLRTKQEAAPVRKHSNIPL